LFFIKDTPLFNGLKSRLCAETVSPIYGMARPCLATDLCRSQVTQSNATPEPSDFVHTFFPICSACQTIHTMKTLHASLRILFAACLLLVLAFATESCKKEDPAPTPTPTSAPTPTPGTKSAAKAITGFALNALSPAVVATVDEAAKTTSATVPAGTDLTKLVPTITVSDKATVSPATGAAQDFSKAVTYTVTAEDGTTQAYSATVKVAYPTNGLVAYYPFNGNTKDESGKGINGILNGAVPGQDRKGGATCYYFDGTGSSIVFTGVPTTATQAWTISLWVNTPSLNQLATFVSVGFDNGTRGDGYSIGMGNGVATKGDVIQGLFGGLGYMPFNVGIEINKWLHFVMVRQNGVTRLYKSGIAIVDYPTAVSPLTPTGFTIGCNTAGGAVLRPFKGSLDDIRIYDRALTNTEVEALAKE
jgi:Concanavalin A-like lectin/glucanases superfamily/Domain of unknown function (DUF5018)